MSSLKMSKGRIKIKTLLSKILLLATLGDNDLAYGADFQGVGTGLKEISQQM